VFRITLVSNAIHLEAARRLRHLEARSAPRRSPWRDLLIHEPRRTRLSEADRQLWPLRLAVHPLLMAGLMLPALLGLVEELRLPHLCRVGRALRVLARRARSLSLIDDGLDQYREQPRAVEPLVFRAGTPLWLFSDAIAFRAPWCERFRVGELGPLYDPAFMERQELPAASPAGHWRTLILDAPGLERLAVLGPVWPWPALAGPRLVLPHPVLAKRAWSVPPGLGERELTGPPEPLLAASGEVLVVVGESMTLLAALALRPLGSPLLVTLPAKSDANLRRMVAARAAQDSAVQLLV
jgi:hypothetical protein